MKFGRLLEDQQIVEWKKAYMNYRLLKKLIKRIKKQREQEQPLHRYNSLAHQRVIGPLYQWVAGRMVPTATATTPPASASTNTSSVNTSSTLVNMSPPHIEEPSNSIQSEPLHINTQLPQVSFQEVDSNSENSNPSIQDPPSESDSFWQRIKRKVISPTTHTVHFDRAFVGDKKLEQQRKDNHAKMLLKKEKQEQIEALIQIEKEADWLFLSDATYLALPLENQHFFIGLYKELNKVNQFYEKEEAAFHERHQILKSQIDELEHGHRHDYNALNMLKEAFKEHYRSLQLLNNFRVLNYTAYKKILKKYNKVSGHLPVPMEFSEQQVTTHEKFYSSPLLEKMITETEDLFIEHLYEGDRKKGMDKLRLKAERIKQHPTHVYRTGLLTGTAIVQSLVWLYYYQVYFRPLISGTHFASETFYLFRLVLFPILLGIFVALDMRLWSHYRINYDFIFQLDPRSTFTSWNLLYLFLILFNILVSSSLLYMWLITDREDPYGLAWITPLVFYAFLVIILFFPFKLFYSAQRFYLIKLCFRICLAPFFQVKFVDFWLADQFTSLGDVLFDFQFLFCVYQSDYAPQLRQFCEQLQTLGLPLLTIVPFYLRMMQCFRRFYDTKLVHPHITNAYKYIFSIIVIILAYIDKKWTMNYGTDWNQFRTAWLIVNSIRTLYAHWWDIRMDWGLLSIPTSKKEWRQRRWYGIFLRNEMLLHPIWYYLAMIENFVIRCLWIFMFLGRRYFGATINSIEWIPVIIIVLELFRRFIWNIFRLENEQLNNVENFRVVVEMPIPFKNVKETGTTSSKLKMLLNKILFCFDNSPPTKKVKKTEQEVQEKPKLKTAPSDLFNTTAFEAVARRIKSDKDLRHHLQLETPLNIDSAEEAWMFEHQIELKTH